MKRATFAADTASDAAAGAAAATHEIYYVTIETESDGDADLSGCCGCCLVIMLLAYRRRCFVGIESIESMLVVDACLVAKETLRGCVYKVCRQGMQKGYTDRVCIQGLQTTHIDRVCRQGLQTMHIDREFRQGT